MKTTRSRRGYSLVELAMVCAFILILTGMIVPIARFAITRQKEAELRASLRSMRTAVDDYKRLADQGLIQVKLDSEGYPPEIEELVEGVELVGQIRKKRKFLRKIPIDPMTGKAEWGLRSYQDEPDSTSWGRQNVYDVYSLSRGRALDGTYYKDW